jgi:hypothetical protein
MQCLRYTLAYLGATACAVSVAQCSVSVDLIPWLSVHEAPMRMRSLLVSAAAFLSEDSAPYTRSKPARCEMHATALLEYPAAAGTRVPVAVDWY